MAELTSTPQAPVMTGILHPQLPHRFAVYFRAVMNPGTSSSSQVLADAETAMGFMNTLKMQLTTVELPELLLGGYAEKHAPGKFGVRRHNGNVRFVFQEDATGRLSEAIDGMTDGSTQWIGATVCKLDGTDGVLEAYDLRGVTFLKSKLSTLTYYSHGASARGTITDTRPDDRGSPLFTANVNLGLSDGSDVCVSQTVTASADLILVARFPGGKALNEVLGDL